MSRLQTHTVASGFAWTMAGRWADRALGFVSIALLARLLTPADFGLVAMATVVVAAIDVFFAFGFDWALVRHPDPKPDHYSTAWTLRIIFGLSSACILAIGAPFAGDYFSEPRLVPIAWLLAASTIVGSLENPGLAEYRRTLAFRPEFIVRTGAKFTGIVVSVAIAASLRSYWALPIGVFAGRLASTLLSYRIHPFRPRPTLSGRRDLLSFSVWMLLSNILEFARARLVDVFIARQLGSRSLGLFSLSQELANMAVSEIAAPLNRVVFGKYSASASNRGQLKEYYLAVAGMIWLVALPAAAGLALVAPFAVPLIFGHQWTDAVPVVRILSLGAVLSILSANTTYVYLALNQGRRTTLLSAIGILVMIITLTVLVPRFGLLGAAMSFVCASIIVLPINFAMLFRQIPLRLSDLARTSWRPLAATLTMAVVTYAVANHLGLGPGSSPLRALAILVAAGATCYLGVMLILWRISGSPNGAERTFADLAIEWSGRSLAALRR